MRRSTWLLLFFLLAGVAVIASLFDASIRQQQAAADAAYQMLAQGDGTFQEVGLWSGAALDAMGNAQAGMGLDAGDLLVDEYFTYNEADQRASSAAIV